MSDMVYPSYKPLVWLKGEVKTPPFSVEARVKVGYLLRELQSGALLSMPDSKPMFSITKDCYELRVKDSVTGIAWRIIYWINYDAIVILEVFAKKTEKTPKFIIDNCKRRIQLYIKTTRG